MTPKQIIEAIKAERPEINTLLIVEKDVPFLLLMNDGPQFHIGHLIADCIA